MISFINAISIIEQINKKLYRKLYKYLYNQLQQINDIHMYILRYFFILFDQGNLYIPEVSAEQYCQQIYDKIESSRVLRAKK